MKLLPQLLSDDLNRETTEVISPSLNLCVTLCSSSRMQVYFCGSLEELRIIGPNIWDPPVPSNSNLRRMTPSADKTRKAEYKILKDT